MVKRTLLPAVCLTAAMIASPSAQSDLDTLMSQVLDHRDENWKKLQQYTLNEKETLQITALVVFRIFGFEHEYLWFPRAGFFVRSPLKSDGVTIDEAERQRAEDAWLRRAQNREKRVQERRAKGQPDHDGGDDPDVPNDVPCNVQVNSNCLVEAAPGPGDIALTGGVEDIINQTFEPDFIRSANFMRFKFDGGQYALVGREKMIGRDVLKIEYYPKILFKETHANKPCERRGKPDRCDTEKEFEEQIEAKMNKVSLVTLWVDPAEHQILRYDFRFQDLDFLPGRSIVRFESARASMEMAEPFPNVWLPASVTMRFRVGSAAGPLEARYDVKYGQYRLPETKGRVLP